MNFESTILNGMNLILRKSERNVTPPHRISNKRGNWNYNDAISYQSNQQPLIPTNTYLQMQAHKRIEQSRIYAAVSSRPWKWQKLALLPSRNLHFHSWSLWLH